MLKIKIINLVIVFLFTMPGIVTAAPAKQNELRLLTGAPKRNGETAFSYMVTWRKDDANLHRANGLTFINGSDTKKPTSDVEVARKVSKALNASIGYDAPQERGATAKNAENKAEVYVANKKGFDLAQITTRDYSNQQLQYSIPGKSFKAASVKMAIDLVYSAAVDYVDGFSSGILHKSSGGKVTISIDNKTPIEVSTEGKSTEQIEAELAAALGNNAKVAKKSIYPNFVERKSRNYKPFDGGEIQLLGLEAKTITIDVDDAGLGVLTKFQFPDVNKPTDVAGNINYIVGLLIFAVVGYFAYAGLIKNKKTKA